MSIQEEAKKILEKPTNRVRIVVMVNRENEALLYRLGNGRITKGMDVVFETLRLYQEKDKKRKVKNEKKNNKEGNP